MDRQWLEQASIIIVDDQESNVILLQRMLEQQQYRRIRTTTSPRECLEWVREAVPDIVLLDLLMPEMDGFQVLEELKSIIPETVYLPVVVLTADTTTLSRRRALSLGAKDFLTKPLDAVEVSLRLRNLLETRWLHVQLHSQNARLDEQVRERTLQLAAAKDEILLRLARTAEYRDDDTGRHTQRVGKLAGRIAERLGQTAEYCALIHKAALLHDIGKVAIPDRILLKPAALTTEEYAIMKGHTVIGGQLLDHSEFDVLKLAREIALAHHERWDGSGYPNRLKAAAIPLAGRIVAVADAFDAMTHARPYKPAASVEQAVLELQAQRERQFDPQIVRACLQVLKDDAMISQELID